MCGLGFGRSAALKAQATSLTGRGSMPAVRRSARPGIHYLPAGAMGIVAAFTVNFLIANRFVFTAARRQPEVPTRGLVEFEGLLECTIVPKMP